MGVSLTACSGANSKYVSMSARTRTFSGIVEFIGLQRVAQSAGGATRSKSVCQEAFPQ